MTTKEQQELLILETALEIDPELARYREVEWMVESLIDDFWQGFDEWYADVSRM